MSTTTTPTHAYCAIAPDLPGYTAAVIDSEEERHAIGDKLSEWIGQRYVVQRDTLDNAKRGLVQHLQAIELQGSRLVTVTTFPARRRA